MRKHVGIAVTGLLVLAAVGTWMSGSLPRPVHAGEVAVTQPQNAAFEALKGLAGTWVAVKTEAGQKPLTVVFKTTAAGSAVSECMFPGSDHEMVNMYTQEGGSVVMIHYCAMGNQPRMKAAGIKEGVMRFAFVDGGNIKSRDDPHMDSLEITINGDTLVEKWSNYGQGKTQGEMTLEFKKQK